MKFYYGVLLFVVCWTKGSMAQNFEYGKITGKDIALKNSIIDSNANAMVIREYGEAAMKYDDINGNLFIDFEYHVRIKIFNKNGFGSGNIVIPRRIYRDGEDDISLLTATTMNYVNGNLTRYELDKKNIFTEKRNKYYTLTKFTMPNLMEGSIIEYSYHLKSPYIFNFKTWEFQSDIPKLYSEFIAYIPALYNYNVSLRGYKKLDSTKAEVDKECIHIAGRPFDCSRMTYVMKNIPAFIEEEYMTAPSNFKSAIYYELSDYYKLNGGKESVTKTWKDVDYELVNDKFFGEQMKRKDLFKDITPEILKNAPGPLDKANSVYNYIRKNIKSNGFIGIYSENTVKKTLETHSGNTGDINLALIAALSSAGLDAEAVILSTRANGAVNSLYPVISDFNYVVAKVNISGSSYLLDASQPQLPFGLLPLSCINGHGRVINLKKPSYWYDLKASQKEFTWYNLDAVLTSDGKIKGHLVTNSLGYAALRKREQIAAANSVNEFVEKLDEQMPATSILRHSIENIDSLDKPLTEDYEIEMNAFDNMDKPQLFLNPFFIDRIQKNPFNLNERTYPVDLGSSKEIRVSVRILLPDDFTISDKPKDISLALAGGGGKFISNISAEERTLVLNELFQLNKPIYGPEEYLSLKEFYSRIIQLQKTDIVLQKQNK